LGFLGSGVVGFWGWVVFGRWWVLAVWGSVWVWVLKVGCGCWLLGLGLGAEGWVLKVGFGCWLLGFGAGCWGLGLSRFLLLEMIKKIKINEKMMKKKDEIDVDSFF
jgi:hypothetical protein